mmetsp:Transcript_25434/g.30841  ORF Transcript_25434/g.30841 Transcript_25434/m.30841 type:complete len:80 (+) Transcript_25434:1017-1256(+)
MVTSWSRFLQLIQRTKLSGFKYQQQQQQHHHHHHHHWKNHHHDCPSNRLFHQCAFGADHARCPTTLSTNFEASYSWQYL